MEAWDVKQHIAGMYITSSHGHMLLAPECVGLLLLVQSHGFLGQGSDYALRLEYLASEPIGQSI